MDNVQELFQIEYMIFGVMIVLLPLILLTAILVFQNVRRNRLLKSIDQSLKLLPGVAREQKRAA